MLVLGLVPRLAPFGMIDVLPAAALVASDCLDVPAGVGADADIFPRGGDNQIANANQRGGVANRSYAANVDEPFAMPTAVNAGIQMRYIAQPGRLGAVGVLPSLGERRFFC